LTPPRRNSRSLALVAALTLLAASLEGCGRRGPLELPPDVQARGAYLRAEEEAKANSQPPAKTMRKTKAGEEAAPPPPANPPPPPIPGTIGNRSPEQYPFLLDPLL
jgi:predicted small lipoprotein YifL